MPYVVVNGLITFFLYAIVAVWNKQVCRSCCFILMHLRMSCLLHQDFMLKFKVSCLITVQLLKKLFGSSPDDPYFLYRVQFLSYHICNKGNRRKVFFLTWLLNFQEKTIWFKMKYSKILEGQQKFGGWHKFRGREIDS